MCGGRMVPRILEKWRGRTLTRVVDLGDLRVWVGATKMEELAQRDRKNEKSSG